MTQREMMTMMTMTLTMIESYWICKEINQNCQKLYVKFNSLIRVIKKKKRTSAIY